MWWFNYDLRLKKMMTIYEDLFERHDDHLMHDYDYDLINVIKDF